jgi:hypothetical protein
MSAESGIVNQANIPNRDLRGAPNRGVQYRISPNIGNEVRRFPFVDRLTITFEFEDEPPLETDMLGRPGNNALCAIAQM